MPDITVTFWGICTIIHGQQEVETPRMVLVAARGDVIRKHRKLSGVKPHFARIHIPTSDIAAIGSLPVAYNTAGDWMRFDLDYVKVAIANATGNLEMEVSCLPHLQNFIGVDPLDPPTPATIEGGPAIACIFELQRGQLRAVRKTKGGAGLSVLTAQCAADPVLSITPFGNTTPSRTGVILISSAIFATGVGVLCSRGSGVGAGRGVEVAAARLRSAVGCGSCWAAG